MLQLVNSVEDGQQILKTSYTFMDTFYFSQNEIISIDESERVVYMKSK